MESIITTFGRCVFSDTYLLDISYLLVLNQFEDYFSLVRFPVTYLTLGVVKYDMYCLQTHPIMQPKLHKIKSSYKRIPMKEMVGFMGHLAQIRNKVKIQIELYTQKYAYIQVSLV